MMEIDRYSSRSGERNQKASFGKILNSSSLQSDSPSGYGSQIV